MALGMIASGVAIIGGISAMSSASKAGDRQSAAIQSSDVAAQGQLELARQQDARAQDQWNRYKTTYQPLEDQMIDESKGMGSTANQNKAAADAAATTAATFAGARDRMNKNPGINPASQQYQQMQSGINLAEAASTASAETGARESVKDRALAAQTNALSLGKGLPASATAMGASAGAIRGSAGAMYGNVANASGQEQSGIINGIGSAVKGATGIYNSTGFQKWMNGGSNSDGGFNGQNNPANQDGLQSVIDSFK
jgi:hypothetical protein